jgi:hypothetical protein
MTVIRTFEERPKRQQGKARAFAKAGRITQEATQSQLRAGGVYHVRGVGRVPIRDLPAVQQFFRSFGERHPINQMPTLQRLLTASWSKQVEPGLPYRLAELFQAELRGVLAPIEERLLFAETARNEVVSGGLNSLINVSIAGATQITQWYVVPTDGTPTIAAGDTYASHAGWTEITAYDEGTRQTYDEASSGTGALSNTASPATLTINASTTIGGAGLVGGGSAPSTKGNTAGGGTLLSVVAFTGGDRALVDDDVLEITYNVSVADDGA